MPKIVHNQQRFSEIRLLFIVLVVFKPAATEKKEYPTNFLPKVKLKRNKSTNL